MARKKTQPNWQLIRENDPVAKHLSDPKFRKRVVESKKVYKRKEGKKVEPDSSKTLKKD